MINAVIFDLDGIIIESEPLWKEVEKKVFAGIGLNLTTEMCRRTIGLDTYDTIKFWYAERPWTGKDFDQLYHEIIESMRVTMLEKVELKEGFSEILQMMKQKSLPVAVATSSPEVLIRTALNKFGILGEFDIINSSEKEEYGKPHPGVYLTTSRKLGEDPRNCLAFEDSFNGAIAAKAARMKVVTVPDAGDFNDRRFDFSDLKLSSLHEFTEEKFDLLNNR
ncbi:MAG: hexitol phosphatase HxpB [Bacteroidales bacterium]|nr:hexitol phosphatase HxpB [Bacteroidales bacterium]